MKQRLGLSLLGGALALSLASVSAMALPAGNGTAFDTAAPATSDATPVRWRGGIGFGFYPGFYGYYGYYPYYRPYYYRPYYYDYYYYPRYRYYRRHRHHHHWD